MNRIVPIILLLSLLTASTARGQEQAVNGGFQSVPAGTAWTAGAGCTLDAGPETAYGGAGTNVVAELDKTSCSISQDICVLPNSTYTLSLKASRRPATTGTVSIAAGLCGTVSQSYNTPPATVTVRVRVYALSSTNTVISTITDQVITRSNTTFSLTTETIPVTVPNNSAISRVRIELASETTYPDVCYTCVVLQYCVANPGTSGMVIDDVSFLPTSAIVSPLAACTNTARTFTVPNAPAGSSSYSWSFAGGTPATSAAAAPAVTWTAAGSYNVTVALNNGACGLSRDQTVIVSQTPAVTQPAGQTVCHNTATSAVTFAGTGTGTLSYSWTNNNTGIGLAASGTGNIPSFTAVNSGTTPVTATITVTPSSSNGCTGTARTFTITVNPVPAVTARTATVCSGTAFNITPTGVPAGTTYTWTAPAISPAGSITGAGAQSSAQTAISQTLINSTNTAATATYTVTPSSNGCTGSAFTATVTVQPQPQGTITGGTICAGQPGRLTFNGAAGAGPFRLVVNGVTYSGIVSGTAFNASPAPAGTTTYLLTGITDSNNCTNP